MNTRHITQKTLLDDAEMARLLELSTATNRKRGPLIRELIEAAYCDLQTALKATSPCSQPNRIGMRINREGPRHGHFASHRRRLVLPSRATVGAPDPHLRV